MSTLITHGGAKRPSLSDEAILRSVAEEIAKELHKSEVDQQSAAIDLFAALRSESPIFDAYRIARYLDQFCSWDCDETVVDACEFASGSASMKHRQATALWVTNNDIRPKKVISEAVLLNTRGNDGVTRAYSGEIVKVDEVHGQYVVMIPDLGHVRSGMGTTGVIINYEVLHPVMTAPEDFQLKCC